MTDKTKQTDVEAILKPLKEVHDQYSHMDCLLGDPEWSNTAISSIAHNLWMAIKGALAAAKQSTSQGGLEQLVAADRLTALQKEGQHGH